MQRGLSMMTLLKVLLVVLIIIFYKFITNLINYNRCKKFEERHLNWINNKDDDFPKNKSEVISLFKRAGIKDSHVNVVTPITYQHISTNNISVFENFPSILRPVYAAALSMFDDAIGVYRKRMFDSFNPLYWIDCILFFPRHALEYLGISPDNLSFKISNLILTILWWLIGAAFLFFKQHIQLIFPNFLQTISQISIEFINLHL